MYCPYCGAELPDDSEFCIKCGTPLPIVNSANESTGTDVTRNVQDNYQNSTYSSQTNYQPRVTSSSKGSGKKALAVIIWIVVVIAVIVIGLSLGGSGGTDISKNIADDKKATAISKAIQPKDSTVRALALSAISKNSAGSYNIGQICDIYDYLYKNWTYVNDPKGGDYYAPASESAVLMKGDCDDFAILMASCIEAIGGSARVISAKGNEVGHAYAEVHLANDKSHADNLTNSISRRYGGKTVHYTVNDDKDDFWLNLDWSANHPGGKFFKNVGTILVIYPNGSHERISFTVADGWE